MKRVLFLMLFLLVLGAVNMSAQVRIGGDGEPHTAAVLDLNTDDTDAGNKGALALPRVSLATDKDQLNGATPLTGMLVYNTNASMIDGSGIGVYFYDGSNWVIISGDGIVGNEVTGATADGGLVRSGSGTAAAPYTLGIATGGVTSAMILDGAIVGADIAAGTVGIANTTLQRLTANASLGATAGSVASVAYPSGCNENNTWAVTRAVNAYTFVMMGPSGVQVCKPLASASAVTVTVDFYCFK